MTHDVSYWRDRAKKLEAYLKDLPHQITCGECGRSIYAQHGDTCPMCESTLNALQSMEKKR